jgi:hypothetical protein
VQRKVGKETRPWRSAFRYAKSPLRPPGIFVRDIHVPYKNDARPARRPHGFNPAASARPQGGHRSKSKSNRKGKSRHIGKAKQRQGKGKGKGKGKGLSLGSASASASAIALLGLAFLGFGSFAFA